MPNHNAKFYLHGPYGLPQGLKKSVEPGVYGAHVTHNANQVIANDSETVLAWNTLRYDTGAFWLSTDNTKLWVRKSGTYQIWTQIFFNSVTPFSGRRRVRIFRNNTDIIGQDIVYPSSVDGSTPQTFTERELVAGDYITIKAYQNNTTDLSVLTGGTNTPQFIIRRVGSGPSGAAGAAGGGVGMFQGRLQLDSSTQLSVQRYKGDVVEVNGEAVSLGSGIVAISTDNRIDSTGADAGASLSVDTTYYVYISNSQASFAPNDLRLSTVAPSLVAGVKYLGTSGNALNWRFVGWVRTFSNAGTPNFVDSVTKRFVINYYNRRSLMLFVSETDDSWSYTSASWRSWNNDTGNRVEFIANGEDSIYAYFQGIAGSISTVRMALGIGLDSTTTPQTESVYGQWYVNFTISLASACVLTPNEGHRFLQCLEYGGSNGVFYGDNGEAQEKSGLLALVMG